MTKPRGLYRYDGKRVVTQLEFERELAQAAQGSVLEHPLSDVVMILCAGQRNDLGPHCTGGCCQLALKQAIEVKAIGRQSNVTIVFRDLNLMGNDEYEGQLAKAREAGVQFVRFASSSPPSLSDSVVEVSDILTGAKLSVPYQKVVLATPMLPQGDAAVVAHMLHLTQDASGFFPEVRNRLRPQRYADRGIYVCGAAHHPTEWRDAEFEATSAAFRALRHLTAGVVSSEADAAVVDEQLCTGCATCTHTCPFDAISMRKREGVLDVAWIDGLLCKGCGNCVVACPVKAISTGLSNDRQVMAQIEAALSGARGAGRSRILIFGCEWSGYAAAQLAGARGLQYAPSVRTIQVPCSARIDPMHILWAFLHGADGVFVGACPPGDCHYQSGNRFAQERIEVLRGLLSYKEFDPRRLRLDWITPDDGPAFVAKIESFVEFIRALGPSAIMETEGEGEAVDVSETA
jgi:heterodisulfide reductase subunit A